MIRWAVVLVAMLALLGCDRARASADGGEAAGGRPVVVATTTMLADLTEVLGGEAVEVRGIMKPGADPHLYQPTPDDARQVAKSQMVVTSGLGLEGWIKELVENAGGERPVVVAARGIEPIRMEGTTGGVDPHFWFDVMLWKKATGNVADGLVDLVGEGSEQARAVRRRQRAYEATLDALHGWVAARLETVPEGRRVLVTSHDAFNYFGQAYGLDVVGIQGISTEQEASQRDVANVVELVRSKGAPAVFVESSVNPALVERVARETGVEVAGPLFTDSIGAPGSPAGSYVGMIQENTRLVVDALGGRHVAFEGGQGGAQEID